MRRLGSSKEVAEVGVPVVDTCFDSEIFVALDGGGTKTEAVAFRADGHVLAHILLSAPLNPNDAAGEVSEVLAEVYRELVTHISVDSVVAVSVAFAGGSNPMRQECVARIIGQLFVTAKTVQVMHDGIAALWSGVEQLPGLVLIAGTGSIAYGVDAAGSEFRVGGWGYLIGDEGGAYDLGRRALQAVMAENDGVGAATILTERILSKWNVATAAELIPVVYDDGKCRIAALAELVCGAANEGDAVANEIVFAVALSAAELLRDAIGLAVKKYALATPLSVVCVGGLWRSLEIKNAFTTHLSAMNLVQSVNLIHPSLPPIFGGARYLMHTCERGVHTDFTENFSQTFANVSQRTSRSAVEACRVETSEPPTPSQQGQGLDLSVLGTEGGNPAMSDLDTLDSLRIVKLIAASNQEAVAAVSGAAASIASAIEAMYPRLADGGRLFYVGAGTSGRLGVLDASECPPTFGVPFEKVQGVIAGGTSALLYPSEGAEDDEAQGGRDLQERAVTEKDVVVAIAASGRTPFCIGALKIAREVGALTISISCNQSALLSEWADFPIEVATGAEIIAGSTRMKAGTAQKVILNMLSTIAMIRLGKVYGGQMVDMIPSNQKLKVRARRIVMLAAGLKSEAAAANLLDRADGNMKVAIVMAHTAVSLNTAKRLLHESGGHVRAAVSAVTNQFT
ncbi:N-acetylmuramic acid 6-phosphate etherase [Coraliomargarita sp. SDUM461004]|uniref:N-acetylmuramic acid 6-phosphate etherase n=1 Tax=Thalassobacterium sedimentorum TaxID=3041258 RepID=A0ABU1AHY0_9BACT|nr:N-acetylmuramic acid 6-phosphate etherase [Coraliomargarita sp. SDUM461004]MDQ8194224.1 N-acetylmuramic acid 6-phosphate etherase [Coraliomargarita sp. SDUM461004]